MSTAIAEIPRSAPVPQPHSVASVRRLKKAYGNIIAVNDVNLDIRAGELLALLGPNGAGKTTLVRLLLGAAKPDAGSVSVFGVDPYLGHAQSRVGAMLQVGRVPETLKVREHVDLFSSYYPNPLPMEETLAIAGLNDIKDRRYGELSGGQKQRVLFAISVCGNPDLLFLDEPTVGLDVEARRLMWSQIRTLIARGKTVLLTTHYLNEADALADRILVLNQGSIIAEGTPAEIKTRAMGKTNPLHQPLVARRSAADSRRAGRNRRSKRVRDSGKHRRAGGARVVAARCVACRSRGDECRAGRGVPGADEESQRRIEREEITWRLLLSQLHWLPRARSLARTPGDLRERVQVRTAEEHRIPVYAISTLAFPLMFYVLFGIVLGRNNAAVRNDNATYLLATMGCFGVMAASLFGFGVGISIERGQGWLQVKRASPMPHCRRTFSPSSLTAVVFSDGHHRRCCFAVGVAFGGVRMPAADGIEAGRHPGCRARFRSARWDWRSATSQSRIRRRRWST